MCDDIDVTDLVYFGNPDDDILPITKCVCGEVFDMWDFIISIYLDDAYECPNCRRRLYFSQSIRVYEVKRCAYGGRNGSQ
jgi:hypothetical protein